MNPGLPENAPGTREPLCDAILAEVFTAFGDEPHSLD